MNTPLRELAAIVFVAALVFFTNLGGPRLWDRDEPRNAGCAAEMLARGDWVVPVFNGELRAHKPVLLYWLMISAYAVLGVTEFAARFWSAALGVGTVVIVWMIGRRLVGEAAAGWSAVVLATTLMFTVAARAATPDSLLIFCCTLAMLVYVCGTFRAPAVGLQYAAAVPRIPGGYFPTSLPVAAAMYAVMGLAVLAKGPVGLVLPTAVIGMFLLIMRLPEPVERSTEAAGSPWRRRVVACLRPLAPGHFLRTCWSMRPVTALLASLAVALPWYVWVGMRTEGQWLSGFLLEHNVGRALRPMEGHSGPVLYYPVAVLIGFFPWSILAVPLVLAVARAVRRRDPASAGLVLAVCWVGVYVGLFSLARTKLPSYVTPCYPALALLTGWLLDGWSSGLRPIARVWSRLALATLMVVGLAMLIALPLAARLFLPGDEWLGAIGLVPLVGGAVCLWLAETQRTAAAARAMAATAVVLLVGLFAVVSVRVDRHQQSGVLLGEIAARSPNPRIAAFGCLEPSWVFYAGRPIREFSHRQAADMAEFLAAPHSYVITRQRDLGRLEAELSGDLAVLARVPYFLRSGDLVLVGSAAAAPRLAAPASPPPARR